MTITNKEETETITNKEETETITNKEETETITNKEETETITNKEETEMITNKEETETRRSNIAEGGANAVSTVTMSSGLEVWTRRAHSCGTGRSTTISSSISLKVKITTTQSG